MQFNILYPETNPTYSAPSYLAPTPFSHSVYNPAWLYSYLSPRLASESSLPAATAEPLPPYSSPLLDWVSDDLIQPGSSDPLDAFLGEKRRFIERSAEDVLGLIAEREQLRNDHLRKIDGEWCGQRTRLFQVEYVRPGLHSSIDRVRANIERDLLGLERERRMEEVACWRDTTQLRGDLREILREAAEEKRRASLLGGESS